MLLKSGTVSEVVEDEAARTLDAVMAWLWWENHLYNGQVAEFYCSRLAMLLNQAGSDFEFSHSEEYGPDHMLSVVINEEVLMWEVGKAMDILNREGSIDSFISELHEALSG